MNPTLKSVLAIIVGIVAGSLLNMGIVTFGGSIIPPPEGAIITTMEGLKETMYLFQPIHFVMPFLAHALGTLLGAFVAAYIAPNYKMKFAITIGCFFLLGGIMNTLALPYPTWFVVLDLVGAYLPMAFIGAKLAIKK